jgi:hypothetical protein
MIPDSEIIELKKIIASEYQVELSLEEVRRIGESLVNIASAILNKNHAKGHYEA